MKIRNGFVSNSSTSSFVCDVCGRSESGWDMSHEQAEMFECINGHTVCIDEAVEDLDNRAEELEKQMRKEAEDSGEDPDDIDVTDCEPYYEVEEKYCPVCQMLVFANSDLAKYFQKISPITREEVFGEVKKANKRRKKLYDNEYVLYVCGKMGVSLDNVTKEIKKLFPTYKEFKTFFNSKK